MPEKILSKGYHARVRHLNDEEKRLFPEAEIVRETTTTDVAWAVRNFWRHRLVHLFHPDMFINVVGASHTKLPEDPSEVNDLVKFPQSYLMKLFSKQARVPEDHLTFAAHTPSDKISLCDCSVCVRHRKFHGVHDLRFEAKKKNDQLQNVGISVPWLDETDYCLSESGLLFFEIQSLNLKRIQSVIDHVGNQQMQKIFGRIRSLTSQSRDASLYSDTGGVEIMPH